eukprot:6102408-Pleurochrysis_carterae.AAC.2
MFAQVQGLSLQTASIAHIACHAVSTRSILCRQAVAACTRTGKPEGAAWGLVRKDSMSDRRAVPRAKNKRGLAGCFLSGAHDSPSLLSHARWQFRRLAFLPSPACPLASATSDPPPPPRAL